MRVVNVTEETHRQAAMATMRRAQGLWSKTSAIDRSDCTDPGEMTSPQGKDVELERAKIAMHDKKGITAYCGSGEDIATSAESQRHRDSGTGIAALTERSPPPSGRPRSISHGAAETIRTDTKTSAPTLTSFEPQHSSTASLRRQGVRHLHRPKHRPRTDKTGIITYRECGRDTAETLRYRGDMDIVRDNASRDFSKEPEISWLRPIRCG